MKLSRYTLKYISSEKVVVPKEEIFDLPEKILQFGTGMLLRGLPDYFIDKANRRGIFNGRIVVVKTTSNGDATEFDRQDGLYTLCERGMVEGRKIEENVICSSLSRILVAQNDWTEILECAHNPQLKIIISNTTEVGIQLTNDDIRQHPPASYPGKLLAFLYERFIAFNGSGDSGFVIVPTELISENGRKLESIVLELAHLNSLEGDFIDWIEKANYFCTSLVDRIVTGMPAKEVKISIENELGYTDELLIVSEGYALWAIEGDERIKDILSFAEDSEGIVIKPDITLYRELKLRVLNGTHTLACALAFFSNCDTVRDAMEDEAMAYYISNLMKNEIAPSILYEVDEATKQNYVGEVLDRFRNPQIGHYWRNITCNYSFKMRHRCIPLLINYYKNYGTVPQLFALGFAAYIYFMKTVKQQGKDFYGEFNDDLYLIEDERAEEFYRLWNKEPVDRIVKCTLKNEALWGCDLSELPGFCHTVTEYLNKIGRDPVSVILKNRQVVDAAT